MVMVTATLRPRASNGSCARGHSSASTTASLGATRSIMAATMSGAIIGLIGAHDQPRLGHAELGRMPSTEFSQNSMTMSPRGQTARQQPVGDLVGQLVGLPVGQPCEARVGAGPGGGDHRLLVGKAPGHPLQQVADAGALPAVDRPPVVQAGHIEISFHAASADARRQ